MKKDIFSYLLTNNSRDLGTFSNPIFNINYLQKKNNYVRITCYVDQVEAMLLTISNITNIIYLESNLNQVNSYNSSTKGTSNILCVLNRTIQEHASSEYQNSNASYQGAQTPIQLGSLPDSINLKLVKANGNVVDMDTGSNTFTVKLRFECEYKSGCGCGCD
jgi:hypothetical protein